MRERLLLVLVLGASLLIGNTRESTRGAEQSIAQEPGSASEGRAEVAQEEHPVASRKLQRLRAELAPPTSVPPQRGRRTAAGSTKKRTPPAAPSPRVPVLHPAVSSEEIHIRHRILADQVLRAMPERCQDVLRNFYVRYDGPDQRGLGGKSTIILTGTVPDGEFRALFVHEFGHLLDLGCLQGSPASGATAFLDGDEVMYGNDPSVAYYEISWLASAVQRPEARPEHFLSGYASWDAFEDFAEGFAVYVLHREYFAARAQENSVIAAKYAWFQTNLPDLPALGASQVTWDGKVPWDVTKLPYAWTGSAAVARK